MTPLARSLTASLTHSLPRSLQGKDITAHRNILQARCPKFAELIDVVARHRESLNNAAAAAAASGDAATTTTTTTKDTPSNAERETSTPAPSRERRQKSPHRTRKDSSSMKRTDKKKRRRREISTKCHYSDEEQMYVISVTGVAFAVYRALLEYLYTGIYDSLSALEVRDGSARLARHILFSRSYQRAR